ncbi:hypothetical protein ZIOFF_015750 [Zingiber officinale]|uniref:Uncharacterized protein n=1 Tax=Zingiber officinale TaxID=94328 RepID=A0A8J5LQH5_ZINOF|nr:hypothetical protein ZIOFF_015750 [Zingiber officinale]
MRSTVANMQAVLWHTTTTTIRGPKGHQDRDKGGPCKLQKAKQLQLDKSAMYLSSTVTLCFSEQQGDTNNVPFEELSGGMQVDLMTEASKLLRSEFENGISWFPALSGVYWLISARIKGCCCFVRLFYVFVLRIHTALVAASAAAVLQTAALIAGCLATAITRKKEEQDEQLIAGYSAIFSVQRSSLLSLVSFPHKVLLPL